MVSIVVLMSPSSEGARPNPTVQLLEDSLPEFITVRGFSWKRALSGGYDLLHVHWPDALVRSRGSAKTLATQTLLVVLLVRLALLRVPLVWTVHNRSPHEAVTRREAALLRLFEASCSARVFMFPSAIADAREARDVLIPRGDYEPSFARYRVEPRGPHRRSLAIVGQLREYKGIESFISSLGSDPPGGPWSLVIAGEAHPSYAVDELRRLAKATAGVTLMEGFQPDERLAALVRESAAVVLPYPEMYNSGVALLSLTLGVPVVVTDSPTMRDLREEVGESWVRLLPQRWRPPDWEQLAAWLDEEREGRPAMPDRDWSVVGARYAELYRQLMSASRNR